MATKKHRIQAFVDPQLDDSLRRIARYQHTSVSALVGRMLEEGAEVLHQLADTLEEAHGLQMKLPHALSAKFDALGQVAQQLEHGTQELLDQVQEEAVDRREKQGEKRPRRSATQGKTL